MPHRHKKSIHVNLEVEPTTLSDCAQENPYHWFTLGDLHGNALKLLYFLRLHGAAQMGSPGDYARFVAIYNTTPSKLTQNDISDIEAIIARMIITPTSRIRLLGDELCDRGSNDYYTLLLLEKLIQGTKQNGKIEILLSNHSDSFIECHESKQPYHMNSLSAFYKEQGASASRLQYLLQKQWITQDQVDQLFNEYKLILNAISYEVNAQGEISSIYTHAPMGENDIFKMGLGIEQYSIKTETNHLVTDNHRTRINIILDTIRARKNKQGIPSRHLAELIDLINEIVAFNAAEGTLHELMQIGPNLTHQQLNGWGLDAKSHPFHMLLWNRDPRHDKKINNRRICAIHYVNGHDMGLNNENHHRKSHDNALGKGAGWHVGDLGYSSTDPTVHQTAEPYLEIPEDPYRKISLVSIPAVAASMTAAVALGQPIAKIPHTEGVLLDALILPYLAGKLTYWLNYGLRMLCEGGKTDPQVIAKDSANLQWQVTLGMGGMEGAKHLSELLIQGINSSSEHIASHFFENTLSFSTEFIKGCPIEMKGALMLVSGFGFAMGATIAKWHQTHERVQGPALYAELAVTFCFGFIIGAAAAIGYKNEVAQFLMPAATTAVLMMGVHKKWAPHTLPAPEAAITQAAPKNGGQQSSTQTV